MTPKMEIKTADWDKTMKLYMKKTRKSVPEVLNSKAFMIMVGAATVTPVADKAKIRKWAKWTKKSSVRLRQYARKRWPRQVSDQARKRELKDLVKARVSSVGYIKSGWLTPIAIAKKWANKAGARIKTKNPKGMKQRGVKLGKMRPAKDGISAACTFINMAGAMGGSGKKYDGEKHSQSEAAKKFGEPALKKGFRKEQASMKRYLAMKLQQAAKKAGAT